MKCCFGEGHLLAVVVYCDWTMEKCSIVRGAWIEFKDNMFVLTYSVYNNSVYYNSYSN